MIVTLNPRRQRRRLKCGSARCGGESRANQERCQFARDGVSASESLTLCSSLNGSDSARQFDCLSPAMPIPGSSYFCLLPYRTRALVLDEPLSAHLTEQAHCLVRTDLHFAASQIAYLVLSQAWINSLQHYIESIQHQKHMVAWGHDSPAEFLLDTGRHSLSSPASNSLAVRHDNPLRKLKTKVIRGLEAFTTACLLYDVLVWLEGDKGLQNGVLKHARRNVWVGKWPVRFSFIACFSVLISVDLRSLTSCTISLR